MQWHEWGERDSRVKMQGTFYINEISLAEREIERERGRERKRWFGNGTAARGGECLEDPKT